MILSHKSGMTGSSSVSDSGTSSRSALSYSPWMCQDCEEDEESKKHYLVRVSVADNLRFIS